MQLIDRVKSRALSSRFRRLLRETWRRMPRPVRVALRRHWRPLGRPAFALLPRLWDGSDGTPYAGYCAGGIGVLLFSGTWMDAEPDEAVRCVIAHELGHEYRSATGEDLPSGLFEEKATDALVESWGFSMSRFVRSWCGMQTGPATGDESLDVDYQACVDDDGAEPADWDLWARTHARKNRCRPGSARFLQGPGEGELAFVFGVYRGVDRPELEDAVDVFREQLRASGVLILGEGSAEHGKDASETRCLLIGATGERVNLARQLWGQVWPS